MEATSEPPTTPLALQQMQDVKSPAYQIAQLGFKAGSVVKLKKPDPQSPCILWVVKEVRSITAVLAPTGIHAKNIDEVNIQLANLKEQWHATAAKPQEQIDIKKMNPERTATTTTTTTTTMATTTTTMMTMSTMMMMIMLMMMLMMI